jgi:hypothetical protein
MILRECGDRGTRLTTRLAGQLASPIGIRSSESGPDVGDLHEIFARVLVATHGDRARAAELARQAHDDRAQLPDAEEDLTALDAWRTSEGLK